MLAECLCPGLHAAILKSVTAADDRLEVGDVCATLLAGLLLLVVKLRKCVGDVHACFRPETVVVQVEVLEGNVRGEKVGDGLVGVDAESIVVQVDSGEVRKVGDLCEQVSERFGDLVEEATREDVGKVGNLSILVPGRTWWLVDTS